jgi:protein-S-isoprenylcysteine O-methyltransferase Ste14
MRQKFFITIAWSLGYLVLALLCLIQWREPDLWGRVDLFAGGYLGLRFLSAIHSLFSSQAAFQSRVRRQNWWGQNSNAGWTKWVKLLMAADLLVFMDYGHWRLTPALAQPTLQIAGLALYLAVAIWQTWTDFRLAKYFSEDHTEFLTSGPYRYIRHPRYAAAVVGKIAMALALASSLGWVLTAAWTFLLLRQIALEEKHLRSVFGAKYEDYIHRTARILPGIY